MARVNLLGWVTRGRTVDGHRTPSVLDWLVAVALFVVACLEIAVGVLPGPVWVAAVAQLASILPVAFRRVAPLPAIAISSAANLPYVVTYHAAHGVGGSLAMAGLLLLLVYSVGRHADGRRLLVAVAFGLLLSVEPVISRQDGLPDVAINVLLVAGTLGLGMAIRIQTERSIALAVAADRARGGQVATAQAAVQEERARIARELHDVVAHNVGLIVLQAGGARSVLDTDPERAARALEQVEMTGRQTLAEMRHVVGVLRGEEARNLRPLPRLDRVPALVGEARAAGLSVDLAVDGPPSELPTGLELAAYRLIEEALTNVRKHAPTACAEVHLGYAPDGLRIEVRDDGGSSGPRSETARPALGIGYGLIGMRERVNLYGGRMRAGPLPVRGFLVEAVLPLTLETS